MGRAANGLGSIDSNGYRIHRRRGHVLAGPDGRVYEHRLVLFEVIGEGPHRCHWCDVPVNWVRGHRHEHALVVDHLDEDRSNNDPTNLVPSCHPCNITRRRSP